MIAVFTDNIGEITDILTNVNIKKVISSIHAEIYEVVLTEDSCEAVDDKSCDKFLIVNTGYGKANMGYAFQKALCNYKIDTIIGVGNCGAIKPLYPSIDDIIISKSSMQYDVDFTSIGTTAPKMVGVNQLEYMADNDLIDLAVACAKLLDIKYHIAKFGSADKFMASNNCSIYNKLKFHIEAFDTSAGVIGQLACMSNIPFVYINGVSNFADNNASEMYLENKSKANATSLYVAIEIIKELTKI